MKKSKALAKSSDIIEFEHEEELTESQWSYMLANDLIRTDTQYTVKPDPEEIVSYSYIM